MILNQRQNTQCENSTETIAKTKKLTCMFNFPGTPATAAGAAWTTTTVCAASATAAHFCPAFYLRQYNYVSTEHVCSKALRNSNNFTHINNWVYNHTGLCSSTFKEIGRFFVLISRSFSVLTVPWHRASIIA